MFSLSVEQIAVGTCSFRVLTTELCKVFPALRRYTMVYTSWQTKPPSGLSSVFVRRAVLCSFTWQFPPPFPQSLSRSSSFAIQLRPLLPMSPAGGVLGYLRNT